VTRRRRSMDNAWVMETPPDTGNHINAALGIPVDSQKTPDALTEIYKTLILSAPRKQGVSKDGKAFQPFSANC
jgi:hypothetical protein